MIRKLQLAFIFFWLVMAAHAQKGKHSFALGDSVFLLDGQPFQMISGEMHYPRVPREVWRQRMRMAKAMGLNTIGTYVFWNLHEPKKDVFDFSGNNDIAAFVKMAQEEGLWVVLRPSPYVCAEWEFGGYPWWLQNIAGLKVRSTEAQYLAEYKKYINALGKILAPMQINHGGNILMVQVENEYGSYGSDKNYLDVNRKMFIDAGFDGLLYTCDPVHDVKNGHLDGLLPAVNGSDKPSQIKTTVQQNHKGNGPYYVAEWYPAWFDWWGAKHHTVPAEKYTPGLDSVLSAGISINMYMFHGGTTRGFMNGANYNDKNPYEPQISSYDYDAPLDEAGNATPKFMAFRQVIQKHLPSGKVLPEVPAPRPSMKLPDITFDKSCNLADVLSKPVSNDHPLTFEALQQAYGYVWYRTVIKDAPEGVKSLQIHDLRDYAIVFVDGKRVGVLDRRLKQESIDIPSHGGTLILDILVENLGRINFGPYLLKNTKGITEKVVLDGKELKNWKMFTLPFDDITKVNIPKRKVVEGQPVLRSGTFTLDHTADTYLDMSAWGKGVVWINGHNLGRYWNVGPQQSIYVPAEWLKNGNNTVQVLELIKPEQEILRSSEKPILDELNQPTIK